MSFVNQEDIFKQFEALMSRLFSRFLNQDSVKFERITYDDAIETYGIDKPDLRYDVRINDITNEVKGKGFQVFDSNDFSCCVKVENKSELTRKEIDNLTDWIKRPQIGATGLLWIKHNSDSTIKSSFDKFFSNEDLKSINDGSLGNDTESKDGNGVSDDKNGTAFNSEAELIALREIDFENFVNLVQNEKWWTIDVDESIGFPFLLPIMMHLD